MSNSVLDDADESGLEDDFQMIRKVAETNKQKAINQQELIGFLQSHNLTNFIAILQ